MTDKYDIIYSVGMDCACALYMNKASIRKCSGPFDWLTGVDFNIRMELILNNFEEFFNKEDFVFLPKSKDPNIGTDEECDYYQNMKTGFYFYHDFVIDKFEECFEDVKNKYIRRIDRFYKNIKSSKKVLFIYLTHSEKIDNEMIRFYQKKISDKFGLKVDFLIIENDDKRENCIETVNISDNIVKYLLQTNAVDEKGYKTTLGREIEILPLFKQYGLESPFKHKCKKNLKKLLVNILACFILSKKKRKFFRNKYLN